MNPAVMLYRPGRTSWERQYAACSAYLEQAGYLVVSITSSATDALALISNRQAAAVLVAIEDPGDDALRTAVEAAGGVFAYTRGRSRQPAEPGAQYVTRMAELGTATEEIARLLGLPIGRVCAILGQPEPIGG